MTGILALLRSRKFIVFVVGLVVAIGGSLGFDVDSKILTGVLVLAAVLIGAIAHEDAAAKSNNILAPFDQPDELPDEGEKP